MKHKLKLFFDFQQAIRDFLLHDKYQEIVIPPAVENPGMEPHLHPFSLYSVQQQRKKNIFLHTSPEFKMKELLSYQFEKIFTLSYSFRDEPNSSNHRFQFLMLEWYQRDVTYEQMMNQVFDLITFLTKRFNPKVKYQNIQMSLKKMFKEILDVNLDKLLQKKELIDYFKTNFKILLPDEYLKLSWEDLFFLLFLNQIEPHLKKYPFIILRDYPHQLSSLSELSHNKLYCKRFELYLDGLEIGNCFQELTDLSEQKRRFQNDHLIKEKEYNYTLPEPSNFYKTLARGLPKSSGIAIGVERLFSIICEIDDPFIF